MTLDEAINGLERWHQLPWDASHQYLKDAVKLGIEALKHIRRERLLNIHIIPTLLPGETKEGEVDQQHG